MIALQTTGNTHFTGICLYAPSKEVKSCLNTVVVYCGTTWVSEEIIIGMLSLSEPEENVTWRRLGSAVRGRLP